MDGIDQADGQQPAQKVKITSKELAAKFSTKREVYSFLTIDCKAYLPDYSTLTIVSARCLQHRPIQSVLTSGIFLQYFLKDLIAGRKRFLKDHECRHLQVPQYKSLSLDKLALFINGYPEVHWYYPDNQEMRKLPKQWITNVAYAILGDTFSGWVKEQIEERNSKVALKGNLHVELDPEVHAAFMASTAVSRKCLPSISTVQRSLLPVDKKSLRLSVNLPVVPVLIHGLTSLISR